MKRSKLPNDDDDGSLSAAKHKKSKKKKKKHREFDEDHRVPKHHSSHLNEQVKKKKKSKTKTLNVDESAEELSQNVVGELIIKSEVVCDNDEMVIKSELTDEDQNDILNCVLFGKNKSNLTEDYPPGAGNVKKHKKKKKKKKHKSDIEATETHSDGNNKTTKKRNLDETCSQETGDENQSAKRKRTSSLCDVENSRTVGQSVNDTSSDSVNHDKCEKGKKKKKRKKKSGTNGGDVLSNNEPTDKVVDDNSENMRIVIDDDKDDTEVVPVRSQSQGVTSKAHLKQDIRAWETSDSWVEEDPEIAALHSIKHIFPTKDFLANLKEKGIRWKLGRWNKEEIDQLKLNWDNIFEEFYYNGDRYDILNARWDPDVGRRINQFVIDSEFFVRLGHKIKRPLNFIYFKARQVFKPCKDGPLTLEEIATLIALQKKFGNKWVLIGGMMKRKPLNIKDKWRFLQRTATGEWTTEENMLLVKAIKDITERDDIFGKHKNLPWSKIAERIPSRSEKQCRNQWVIRLCFSHSEEGFNLVRPFSVQEKVDLIDCIVDDESYRNESDIDWAEISKKFDKTTPHYLQQKWSKIKTSIKNYQHLAFPELVEAVLMGPYCKYLRRVEKEKMILEGGGVGRDYTAKLKQPKHRSLHEITESSEKDNTLATSDQYVTPEFLDSSDSD